MTFYVENETEETFAEGEIIGKQVQDLCSHAAVRNSFSPRAMQPLGNREGGGKALIPSRNTCRHLCSAQLCERRRCARRPGGVRLLFAYFSPCAETYGFFIFGGKFGQIRI